MCRASDDRFVASRLQHNEMVWSWSFDEYWTIMLVFALTVFLYIKYNIITV